jgi:hypothetical protein
MSVSNKEVRANSGVVLETLARILDSAPFRSSKQCQDLLRYVVEHSLREDNESLKERVIGCEVFGRRHDYDTADDPVVRIRAGDVRKRLALYYRTMPPGANIEIDIPHGSYRVEFRPFPEPASGQGDANASHGSDHSQLSKTAGQEVADPPSHPVNGEVSVIDGQPAEPVRSASNRPRWFVRYRLPILAALAVIVALGSLSNRLFRPPINAFDSFWNPVFSSPTPPIICVGSSAVYRLKEESVAKYSSVSKIPNATSIDREYVLTFRPGQQIDADDLVPNRNGFVTIGDAAATASVVSMLSNLRKPYDLRFSEDIAFGDLRRSPAILIGAFNNSWTISMDDKLPFVFLEMKYIHEVASPGRSWSTVRDEHGNPTEDYALVSRQLHSKTGEFSITIAGIDMTGTRASAEFVSDPIKLNLALKQLPEGWQGKNLQLLLHSTIINGLPSATDVVAYRVW